MSALNVAEEMSVAMPERAEAAATHTTHPFLWSVRRELWESPSLLVAPIAVGLLVIVATLIAAVRVTGPLVVKLGERDLPISSVAALPALPVLVFLGITMVLVAIFYSLDALLSERQNRSILFWKSLPVSDSATVLSKMAIPIVVLPIVTFAVTIATDIALFIIATIALLAHHISLSLAWAGLPILPLLGVTVYSLIVVTLWYAPIYAWFLLVSAWARRMPLIWAVMPFFLLAFFERIAYHTHHVGDFVKNRFAGVFFAAFSDHYTHHNHVNFNFDWTPGHFLATPGLWEGLLFTALALILIIRLRRSNHPI